MGGITTATTSPYLRLSFVRSSQHATLCLTYSRPAWTSPTTRSQQS
jgi:hypothetical protein